MIDEKIDHILKKLEKQEIFERENPTNVQQSEKMLAITRNIGLFYNILLRGIKAKKILEIGTSTGYSTLWFAEAIGSQNEAKIITIDQDEKKIIRAKKNFEETGVSNFLALNHLFSGMEFSFPRHTVVLVLKREEEPFLSAENRLAMFSLL